MKTKPGSIIERVKFAIREGYAWPGGYPYMILMHDGASICTECAREEFHQLIDADKHNSRDGWKPEDLYYLNDEIEQCAHCDKVIG